MITVLIPFTNLRWGERAVRQLLEERSTAPFEVELLAVVEPLTPGKVSIFLSPERAEALAAAAGERWIRELVPLLDRARIKYRSRVALGAPRKVIAREMQRDGVDRVLLPIGASLRLGRRFAKRPAARASRALPRPVTVVP